MAIRGALRLGGGVALPAKTPIFGNIVQRAVPVNGGQSPTPPSNPAENLKSLFPAEAVTAYPLAMAVAGDNVVLRWILIGVIVALVVVLRIFATQPAGGGKPDWLAILISVISFLLFAASLGGFGQIMGTPAQSAALMAFVNFIWLAVVSHIPVKPAP